MFCPHNPWIITRRFCARPPIARCSTSRHAANLRITPTGRTDPSLSQDVLPFPLRATVEAKNSWLTGTASWSYVAVTQFILGIRASLDGLVVDPCIPADWPSFSARREFRGATYEIEVVNARGTGRGARSLSVDGKPVVGRVIPIAKPGSTVRVKLLLG